MSLSVKTQGGGGGFFPSIWVTGLSETDTVYATMGSKTVYGKWETRTVDETEVSGFLISPLREFGTWTVTATNGEKTKTQDVLVDVATEFEIEMDFFTYLYKYGEVNSDMVGNILTFNNTVTINADDIFINRATSSARVGVCFDTSVDVTNFTELSILADSVCTSTVGVLLALLPSPSINGSVTKSTSWDPSVIGSFNKTNEVLTLDVSDFSGTYYIGVFTGKAATVSGTTNCTVHQIWLE